MPGWQCQDPVQTGKLSCVSLPERLPGASIAIEFRHPSWVRDKARRPETMKFLRSHGLYYTSIDAPEDSSIVPSFIEATGDQVYVRFHGKNRENWFKRNITAAEQFKYLYSERELQSLAKGFGNLQEQGVKRAYAIFNNCYQNFGIMNVNYDGRDPSRPRATRYGPERELWP